MTTLLDRLYANRFWLDWLNSPHVARRPEQVEADRRFDAMFYRKQPRTPKED